MPNVEHHQSLQRPQAFAAEFKRYAVQQRGRQMRKYQALPAILLLVALGACRGDEVAIELREIQEDVVQFGLQNNTDRAVRSVTMELTYFAADGTPLLVDTTTYRMAEDGSGNEKAFLEVGGETFFVQKSPLRTVSAEARVLKVTYMDE